MATIAFFYEVCALLLAVLMFVAFLRGIQGVPLAPEARSKQQGATTGLSVVVLIEPGVDAEHCVLSVLAQSYAKLDLVFVLERGATLEEALARRIEADPRARLLYAEDPPPGWTRRNEAYTTGFRATEHDYVLFLDANVLLRDDALERSLSLVRMRGTDLLTVFPSMTATSRFERLLVPFFLQLTLIGVSMRKINDPESDVAGGFAPFFLFRRVAYEALGGHASVRGDRFADSTLAQRVKDRGYRILVANGTDIAVLQGQSRLRDIWQSWSQSFSETIEGDQRQALLLAALVLALFALPWAIVAWALIDLFTSSTPVASSPWLGVVIIGSASILLGLLHRRSLRNLLDLDDSLSWLQPIAALLAAVMILTSAAPAGDGWLSRFSGAAGTEGAARRVGAGAGKGS